jgi:polar amino acid transport system substrate-binding protein
MKTIIIFLSVCSVFIIIISGCTEPKRTITNLTDVKNISVGAMTGSTGEQLVLERFPDAAVKSFDDIMDAVVALKSNQIEAVITGYPAAMNVCKHNPDLHYLPEPVALENTSIAVKKGNDQLLSELNQIIDELSNNGTLRDMKRRWFKTDLLPYEEVEITMPEKGEVLKIGTSATREPFCYVNAKGMISGHDGELARRIGAKLGRPVQFFDMKFSALIPALSSGKIDLICAGMTATDERMKSVDFTSTYFENSQVLIVKKAEDKKEPGEAVSLNLRSKEDLKDKRIGILLGSVHDTYALKEFPEAELFQYKSPSEILLAVKSGKVDAAIYTTESLIVILRDEKDLALLGDTLFSVPIGMGFNKSSTELRKKFNSFLKEVKENGIFEDMVTRWIINGETEMPVIENPDPKGTLIVGSVGDKGLPFTVLKNNKMIGFDIELSERFAAYIGKELRLVDIEFGSLIISAATNKIDMIASTLMITEERKKKIDFSDYYMHLGASAFALKKNIADYTTGQNNSVTEKSFLDEIADGFYSNIIAEERYLLILEGLKTTILISILATIIGTLLGGLICFMRMSRNKILLYTSKFYISVLRGTPVLVLLMIVFYVVFASVDINPVMVAVIAFGLNFAAYVSEMYRTGIEAVDAGQNEAGIAAGFSKFKAFRYIVLPQAVKHILPVYKGEVITLVKMTSVVGYIAVQDLTKASDIVRGRTFDAFFPLIMVAVMYFLISWLLVLSLSYIERRTDPRLKRIKISSVI